MTDQELLEALETIDKILADSKINVDELIDEIELLA